MTMMVSHNRLFLLLLFCCLSIHVSGSRVNITNNGYRDIVVAISPDVKPDQANDILDKIKLLITEASVDLYEATRHRSYIESVNILIPQTWDNVSANASTWENFQDADVQIDLPNWKYGDRPYTVQLGGCGDPGQYIHLTSDYILNFDSDYSTFEFGPAGKVFVREWARLRYGVFEEHGYTGDDSTFPMFYRSSSTQQTNGIPNDLVPNVCSDKQVDFTFDYGCHVDPQTGLYDSNCTYSFSDQFKPESSMMSDYRMLSSAMHFCDDDPSSPHKHNREAPNKHNAVCDTQSVWSVITRHVDFAGNNNLPATISNLQPKFNVVRVLNGARYVLVTDVSGSMNNYNRIGRLYDSARRWIQYDIPDRTLLGIVKFTDIATVLSDMTVVNNETRKQLMDKVPSTAGGENCVSCGLQAAIDILSPGGNGGVIVLVTDGIDSTISDATPELIAAQIQVVSIAFGRAAENEIENLATKTNGKSYFISDDGNNDELNDAFTGSLTYLPAVPSENLTVLLFQKKYQRGNQFEDSVIVDWSVGRNLTFRIEYTNRIYLQSFSVKSPTGQMYSTLTYDEPAKIAYIEIPGVAEDGSWNFTLTLSSSTNDYANVIVTSKSKSDSAPITVECSVPSGTVVVNAAISPVRLVAVVKQGRNRVIGANVLAYIEKPNASLQVIDLVDTGVGADTTKSDGIYSRYYIDLTLSGRYTLVCVVNGSKSSYIDDGQGEEQGTTMGEFNRVQSGGTFRVEKPIVTSYPPSQVTDLKILSMQVDQMSVTIEWTATGQQMDQGIAKEYQIKYSNVFDNLSDNNFSSNLSVLFGQQDVVDGSFQPLESGSKQRVTLALPKTTDDITYYIAARALNDNNASSNTSNIVSVQFVAVKPPPTQPPTTRATTTIKTTTIAPETSTSVNAGCNSVLTSSSGLLTSPDYPGPYPNSYDCKWTVQVASLSKIRLTFSHFDIESPYDNVEVYDGSSVSPARLLLQHTGSTLPGAVVSSSNEMLVRFVTDGTGNYFRGWRATYTSA